MRQLADPDTAKLTGPQTLADKRRVGPVKLLCIIHVWYQQNEAKIYPPSGESPKVFVVSADQFQNASKSDINRLKESISHPPV